MLYKFHAGRYSSDKMFKESSALQNVSERGVILKFKRVA